MNLQIQPAKSQSGFRKRLLQTLAGLTVLYLVLLIPEPRSPVPPGAGKSPFAWNRDAFWSGLERQFVEARSAGCDRLSERIRARSADANGFLTVLQGTNLPPDAKEFDRLETDIFELAPLVAACPEQLVEFTALAERARAAIKHQSEH